MWKPASSIFCSTAGGGGAAAVITSTGRGRGRRSSGLALMIMLRTTGAPLKWLTPSSAIALKIAAGSTRRAQTLVPQFAASVQGKHQPLQ